MNNLAIDNTPDPERLYTTYVRYLEDNYNVEYNKDHINNNPLILVAKDKLDAIKYYYESLTEPINLIVPFYNSTMVVGNRAINFSIYNMSKEGKENNLCVEINGLTLANNSIDIEGQQYIGTKATLFVSINNDGTLDTSVVNFKCSLIEINTLQRKYNNLITISKDFKDNVDVLSDRILQQKEEERFKTDAEEECFNLLRNIISVSNYMVKPNTYIVKKGSGKEHKKVKGKKIKRANDRDHIILLDPDQIKVLYDRSGCDIMESSGRNSPKPHVRRGHWRDLKNERFTNKKGGRVWVHEARINFSEPFSVHRTIYKILTLEDVNNEI